MSFEAAEGHDGELVDVGVDVDEDGDTGGALVVGSGVELGSYAAEKPHVGMRSCAASGCVLPEGPGVERNEYEGTGGCRYRLA